MPVDAVAVRNWSDPFTREAPAMAPAGLTIAQIAALQVESGRLPRALVAARCVLAVAGGVVVPVGMWARVRPKPGVTVAFALDPKGGGGRNGGKNALRIVSMLAVMVVAGWAGPAAATALGFVQGTNAFAAVATAASAATSFALNAVVNAIAPVPQPDSARRSENYVLTGGANRADPYGPAVVVLGKHRTYGKIAARYFTRTVADKVRLVGIVQWHVGKCALSNLKIGDSAVANFANATFQHRLLGQSYASQITLVSELVAESGEAIPVELTDPAIYEDGLLFLPEHGWIKQSFPRRAQRLSFDFAFPNGLNEGGSGAWQVEFQCQYRKVGAPAWTWLPTSANAAQMPSAGRMRFDEATRDMVRRTFAWTPPDGEGDYEIRFRRWTYEPGINVSDTGYVVARRAHRDGTPVMDDNLCITAFEVQASDQLSGTLETLNAEIESIVPVFSGGNWSTESVSRNPAALFRWLHTGPALSPAVRLTAGQMEAADIESWFTACASDGLNCDFVLDAEMSARDAADLIASAGNAGAVWRGGRRGVVRDAPREPSNLFTADNVRGFRWTKMFPEYPHALRVTFRNAEQAFAPDEILVYAPGYTAETAVNIQAVEIPARVTPQAVWRAGRRMLRRAWTRDAVGTFEIGMEFLDADSQFGARVLVDHHALRRETRPARVTALTLSGPNVVSVTLDEAVTFRAGQSYALQVRRVANGALRLIALSNPATSADVVTQVVTFSAAQAAADAPDLGAMVNFGIAASVTDDCQIIDVSPGDGLTAQITVVPYDPALFDDDAGSPPSFETVAFPPVIAAGTVPEAGGVPGAPGLGGFTLGQIF